MFILFIYLILFHVKFLEVTLGITLFSDQNAAFINPNIKNHITNSLFIFGCEIKKLYIQQINISVTIYKFKSDMLFVNSNKTLTFKGNSLATPHPKDTPGKKKDQSLKPHKRVYFNDNKENININIQLSKLAKQFGSSNNETPSKTANKIELFTNKFSKSNNNNTKGSSSPNNGGSFNQQQQKVNPFMTTGDISIFSTQNSKQSLHDQLLEKKEGKRLKINLKESAQTKSSLNQEAKRKVSVQSHEEKQQLFEEFPCFKHVDKKAKYEASNSPKDKVYCCSKCAVSLATQGYKVKEINREKLDRGKVLQQFLEKIQDISPKMKTLIGLFEKFKSAVTIAYTNQIEKHTYYYDSIINSLRVAKKEGQTILYEEKQKLITELQQMENIIKEQLDDTSFMEKDVLPNINTIMSNSISKISEDKFNSIMANYNQQLTGFELKINEYENYKPFIYRIEGDYEKKLKSCLESLPYFKLEMVREREDTKREERNFMYFSFEDKKKRSVSRGSEKESSRQHEKIQNSFTNVCRPFGNEQLEAENSPSFKII